MDVAKKMLDFNQKHGRTSLVGRKADGRWRPMQLNSSRADRSFALQVSEHLNWSNWMVFLGCKHDLDDPTEASGNFLVQIHNFTPLCVLGTQISLEIVHQSPSSSSHPWRHVMAGRAAGRMLRAPQKGSAHLKVTQGSFLGRESRCQLG